LVLEKERQDWVSLLEKSRKKMNLLEFISPYISSFSLKQIMVARFFCWEFGKKDDEQYFLCGNPLFSIIHLSIYNP
jgi:hypothetical protein